MVNGKFMYFDILCCYFVTVVGNGCYDWAFTFTSINQLHALYQLIGDKNLNLDLPQQKGFATHLEYVAWSDVGWLMKDLARCLLVESPGNINVKTVERDVKLGNLWKLTTKSREKQMGNRLWFFSGFHVDCWCSFWFLASCLLSDFSLFHVSVCFDKTSLKRY